MSAAIIYTGTPITKSWSAGSTRGIELDLSMQAVAAWQPDIAVAANAIIRPTNANESVDGLDNSTGYVYQNGATAGQTGSAEPAWPTSATVKDGSVTWTATTPPAAGADSVSSANWTITGGDGQLTVSDENFTALLVSAQVSGGTSGVVYTITIVVTMASGQKYPVIIYLTTT
jgi:hypothetical protein